MKTLHLGLVLTFIVFVVICTKPVHADSDLIKILDVQVQPSTIQVNNTFSVSATILNNSTYPVYLTSGSCVPAFSVKFDSHAKQVYPDIACTLEEIIQRVDPNVETTISSVNKPGTIYKSIQAGTANANITIPYFGKNQTATDYSNIYYNTSKSFQFQVYDTNETKIGNQLPIGTPFKSTLDLPFEQFKSGVSANDVSCNQGLQLILKAEDGSPACVKPDTAQKLMERGWTKNPTGISALAKPPIGIYNLTLSTNPIILGIPFYINAVVVNHQTEPITYYNGCISPLSVSFDSIKTSTDSVHCLAISKYTLEPNQSVSVQSDKIETLYNTTRPNSTTNAQIKFIYETSGEQGSVVTSMQIPIQNAIMIDCSGELVMLHIAQIDKTVNVTKAIALAYTSPKFLSEIKQYGNLSYSGFYNDWFSSESCHTYWNSTEVMFAVNDGSSSTRNIQVTEDINQTKVLKVSDFVVTPTK